MAKNPLTSKERRGALAVTLLALLLIGGGMWWRSRSLNAGEVPPAPASPMVQLPSSADVPDSVTNKRHKKKQPSGRSKKKAVKGGAKNPDEFGIWDSIPRGAHD